MRLIALFALLLALPAQAGVAPMIQTQWGQSGVWQQHTPDDAAGEPTYPGCTTVAAAQVLNFYRWQDHTNSAVSYVLDNEVSGEGVTDGVLELDLPSQRYDWDGFAAHDRSGTVSVSAVSEFLFHVGATLHVQYGDGAGSPATGKQLENAFRYQWGFNQIARRKMAVISKTAFGYSDAEWADRIRGELDAGRPVIHMAQQVDGKAGHAFVIDGYDDNGLVHVNWGWSGSHDGWYDPNVLEDPSGRQWSREPMIFVGLEPTEGHAADLRPAATTAGATINAWSGNGSLISRSTGKATGYGMTQDEAVVAAGRDERPVVFFQWEIDATDGTRLLLDSDAADRAVIRYGDWSTREEDRVYLNVNLPFVLDPAADGHRSLDGRFFVVAMTFEDGSEGTAFAEVTEAAGSQATSRAATGSLVVNGEAWGGNGSLISLSSGTTTGYGTTKDESRVGAGESVVFFQWEIDGRDGRTLALDAEFGGEATVSYGVWNGTRAQDVTRTVTLPATLDPAVDGVDASDGQYLVIRVDLAPSSEERWVEAVVR